MCDRWSHGAVTKGGVRVTGAGAGVTGEGVYAAQL